MLKELLQKIRGKGESPLPSAPAIQKEEKPKTTLEDYIVHDYDMSNIMKHVSQIENILEIKAPRIAIIPYLAQNEEGFRLCDGYVEELDGCYLMGYYLDGEDLILLSENHPLYQTRLNEAFMLSTIVHELRHVWQRTHASSTYYNSKNAEGVLECIF